MRPPTGKISEWLRIEVVDLPILFTSSPANNHIVYIKEKGDRNGTRLAYADDRKLAIELAVKALRDMADKLEQGKEPQPERTDR